MDTEILVAVSGGRQDAYSYRNHIKGLVVGDNVLVPLGLSNVLCAATVVSTRLSAYDAARATKWVAQKIDLDLDTWNALNGLQPPPEPRDKINWYARQGLKHYRETYLVHAKQASDDD